VSGRLFTPITVQAEAGRRRVHRITCSECPATLDISANTYSGSRASEDLNKIFQRRGWQVGRSANHDLCPGCQFRKRQERRAPKQTAEVIPMSKQEAAPAAADQPRVPTFNDRRIIFAKLEEVYVDEKVGYGSGWSDQRVAKELGCPWAWVAELREQNFGPVRSNEEMRVLVNDAQAAIAEARETVKRGEKLRGDIQEWQREVTALTGKIDALERRVAEIAKQVA